MPGQNLGAPFLERIMRKGRKQNALLNMPQSGGVNVPSPTGLESGQKPPPRPTPAAAPEQPTAPTAAPEAAPTQGPLVQQALNLPTLDEELPAGALKDADGGGDVFPAANLMERFYRVYGRMPDDVDMYVLNFRRQFEENRGRPPTKEDVIAAVRRTVQKRETKPI